MKNNLNIPRHAFRGAKPIFIILSAYCLALVHGLINGNEFALQDFREMVFNALGLPVILWLAPYFDIKAFRRILSILLIVILIWSLIAIPERLLFRGEEQRITHRAMLMLIPFLLSYYILSVSLLKRYSVAVIFLATFPFVVSFSKASIAMFIFTAVMALYFSAHLNPNSKNWILSQYKIKMGMYALLFLMMFSLIAYSANKYTGGIIEDSIRYSFLKERLDSSGNIYLGDTTGGRFAIWTAALKSYTFKPFWGYGLGATVEVYSSGWREVWQLHNYFIQSLRNCGIFGMILILGGWVFWWLRVSRKLATIQNTYTTIVLTSMAIFVLHIIIYGLYGHSLGLPPNAQFFWICIAFLSAFREGI